MKLLEDVEALNTWKDETRVLYTSKVVNGRDIKLHATLYGNFEVSLDGSVVHRTTQPFSAIDMYNKLIEDNTPQ